MKNNMTRKLSLLAMLVALPLALSAQDDDMYFVSSKKKAEPKVTRQQESHTASTNAEGARWQQTPEAEANADYHTGQLRDVDEYNRRGAGRQVLARLDGDTLYVQGQDSLEQKEYLVRYENQYVADEPYADDYYFATRLHRYYGYYHYDPFMWDICYGWYDPWYDPWYGWYGPYYRHGWYSWNTWGWGWGYYHTGWHHGWDYGWHHGWGHAAPYYSYHAYHSYRPGGSASANGGRRAGSLRGGNLTSSGRAYAAPARGGRNTVSTSRSTIGADGRRYSTTPSRSQSRQASTSTRSTTRSTTTTSRSTSRNNTYTAPSRSSSSRSSSGSYSSGTRSSGSSSGGFSGGRSGGGFSGGGSRGGGGRGGR